MSDHISAAQLLQSLRGQIGQLNARINKLEAVFAQETRDIKGGVEKFASKMNDSVAGAIAEINDIRYRVKTLERDLSNLSASMQKFDSCSDVNTNTLTAIEQQIKDANARIKSLESSITWIVLAVLGAVVSALAKVIFVN